VTTTAAAAPRTTILCVDDDEHLVEAVSRVLRRPDREIVCTTDPVDAMRLLEQREIAVMISDYDMPGMTGVELAAAARRARPETVRVLLTGWGVMDAAVDGINRGEVFRYLVKPFDPRLLLGVVAEAVDRHHELVAIARDRKRAARRDQALALLSARYPTITHVERDAEGLYLVKPRAQEAMAGLGLDGIANLRRKA
jgi:two-component system, probable response regulator PhcQ